MAGTVAKFAPYANLHDEFVVRQTSMEEEDLVLNLLDDESFAKRTQALDYLRGVVRKNGGRLVFHNRQALFNGLANLLQDSNWNVRHQCIQLISEMIPGFGPGLDTGMAAVLPNIVFNIGDTKVAIKKSAIQTVHLYLKHSMDRKLIFNALVKHGLENEDPRIGRETVVALPMMLTPEFAKEDLFPLTLALARKLQGRPDEDPKKILYSMDRIRSLVGDNKFEMWVSKFPSNLQQAYYNAYDTERNGYDTPKHDSVKSAKFDSPSREGREVDLNSSGHFNKDFPERYQTSARETNHVRPMVAHRLVSHDDGPYEFGIIPSHVMQQLVDQDDWRIRAQGIEQLKNIMASLRDATPLLPQLLPFISFLCNLLDDVNFKITTVTLEIFGLLVDKLNLGVKPYLKPIVSALTKRLGDLKFVIKQENLRVLMQLMNILSPKPILSHLYEGLDHKNSRVREETLNVIIASLLTFPTYEFDLGALCEIVAPTLADSKPRVRQAALEAFAVLAQSMGPGRLQPLVSAVDSVELGRDGDGVMAAVQARLARRQLPRLGTDGLVEYATPPPASARSRSSTGSATQGAHQGADTEWILNAPGAQGGGSARDRPESDDFLSRSTPGPLPSGGIDGITPQPRRYFSAGRARNKLPWEEGRGDKEEEGNFHSSHPSSAPATQVPRPKQEMQPPIKPKNTWGFGEDEGSDVSGKRGRRRGKGYNGRDDSPNSGSQPSGSYKKEYLKKLEYNARAATLSGSHPRGRVVPLEQDSAQTAVVATPTDKAGVIPVSSMSSPKKRREQRDAEDPPAGTGVRNESPLGHHYVPSFVDQPRDEARNQRASLSNSWPHQSRDFADMPKPKKSQDPLSALDSSLNTSSDRLEASEESPRYKGKEPGRENQTPIPMKPALARSASKRRNKVIPPIPTGGEPSPREGDELDSGRDSSYVPTSNRESGHAEPEIDMESSLRQIRNSASKKRAQKLVNSLSETSLYSSLSAASSRSPSPPSSSLDDSGLFSPMSTLPLDDEASSTPKTTPKRKGKSGAESPFGSKPLMARRASAGRRRSPPTEGDPERNTEPNPFEYQPNSGVTFRDKPSSDVSVVGQRMSYSNMADASEPRPEPVKKASPPLGQASPTLPTRPAPPRGADMRDRKKQKGSPMPGMASLQHPGSADVDDGGNINNDHVVIVGRDALTKPKGRQKSEDTGMLSGSTSNMDTTEPLAGDRASPLLRKRGNHDDREEPPSGVYGVGMRQGAADDYDSDFDEEDPNNISMSRATRERLNSKQQQRKEEIRAEKRAEKERQEQERKEQLRLEEEWKELELAKQAKRRRLKEKRRLEREQKQREQEEWERQREEQEKQERERKQREREENEKRRREREERARRRAEEKERQKEKLKQSSQMELEDIGGLSIMGTGPYDRARVLDSSPVGKPPAHTPKKRGSQSPKVGSSPSTPSSQVSTPSHRSSSLMDELDLKPFTNPDAALQDAFRLINDENWEVKCEGISHIRRLAIFHPKVVNSRLHDAILAVLTEVKNLRSSVARAAIACLGDMFTYLKKNMDQDIDQTTQFLLHKNGESNGFIREDVDKAMAALAMNVSPQRALTALIAAGRDHRNVAVRKCTAQYLVTIVERMGTGRVMSGIKDVTDKVLPTATMFACDSSGEIRYYGKKVLYQLMSHEDFDKLLVKHVAPKHLKDVQNKVEELRQRGLGEMPTDTPSARHRRAESGGSRAKSGSRDSINSPSSTLSTPTSSAKKKSPRGADTGLEECKELFGLLDARDWQQRSQGIQQLADMCAAGHPAVFNNLVKGIQQLADMCAAGHPAVFNNLVKVFDRFVPRLTDNNTKVNLFALQAVRDIIRQVGPYVDSTIVNALVPQLVGNLASKNQQIYNATKEALSSVVQCVDKSLLLQPFANAAQYGNARVKPDMIDKLSDLVLEIYSRKQQSVIRHILPVLWHLLGNTTSSGALPGGTGNIRDATNRLANALHMQMGDALLEFASSLTQRNLQTLKDMLANPVQQ